MNILYSIFYMCALSFFGHVWLFVILCIVAHQAPLPIGFSWQEYWSGLPCPCPGDLPDPVIEPVSVMSPALAGRFFTTSNTWKLVFCMVSVNSIFLINWIFGQQFTYFRFSFYFLWHISRHLIFNYTDIKRFIAVLLS